MSSDLNTQLHTSEVIWNLNDLYPENYSVYIDRECDWCTEEAHSIRSEFHGRLASLTSSELAALVHRLESLDTRLGRMGTFAFLNFTTQMKNATAGALQQRISELVSACGKNTVFFQLEWNTLPDDTVAALLADPILDHYRHYLTSMRRYLPHQLEEKEERLLLEIAPTGRKSWTTLFDKIFGNMKFGSTGRSEEEVLTDLYSADRSVRRQANREMTDSLASHEHILSHIFNVLAADKMISDRLRSHGTWVSSMNLDNQLQDSTVDALVDAVTSRYDIVRRYYSHKREILQLDTLHEYDRYAPLPHLPQQQIDWPTCKEIVLSSFLKFSDQLHDIAVTFFEKNWIHAPVLQGKRGGAFAHPCVPQAHPYVMVNYTGTLRDVSTVAHELGHGIHQVLAAGKGYYNSDTPLVLAETASVFAELLVFNAQLEVIAGTEEHKAFICQKIESIIATVFRQTAMNRFEHKMHTGRREQGELSGKQLSEYWLETQKEMFGNSIELTDEYGMWWAYIPHFLHTPGYVYSYAFGELLTLAIFGIYKEEGSSFIDKYIKLLSSGGSDTPYALLKPFGLDLDDPHFWLKGLNTIDQMLLSLN